MLVLRILQPKRYAASFLLENGVPAPSINMHKIKDVLRLKLDAGLSHQQIAAALGLSKGVVTKYAGLATTAGLHWPAVRELDESTLERRLLSGPQVARDYVLRDYGRLHQELRRKGVTLMLLWEEHRAEHADARTCHCRIDTPHFRRSNFPLVKSHFIHAAWSAVGKGRSCAWQADHQERLRVPDSHSA